MVQKTTEKLVQKPALAGLVDWLAVAAWVGDLAGQLVDAPQKIEGEGWWLKVRVYRAESAFGYEGIGIGSTIREARDEALCEAFRAAYAGEAVGLFVPATDKATVATDNATVAKAEKDAKAESLASPPETPIPASVEAIQAEPPAVQAEPPAAQAEPPAVQAEPPTAQARTPKYDPFHSSLDEPDVRTPVPASASAPKGEREKALQALWIYVREKDCEEELRNFLRIHGWGESTKELPAPRLRSALAACEGAWKVAYGAFKDARGNLLWREGSEAGDARIWGWLESQGWKGKARRFEKLTLPQLRSLTAHLRAFSPSKEEAGR